MCTGFYALGLGPMHNFVAGVGVYFLIRMRKILLKQEKSCRYSYAGIFLYVLIITFNNLLLGLYSPVLDSFIHIKIWISIQESFLTGIVLFSVILFIFILININKKDPFYFWFVYIVAFSAVRHIVQMIFSSSSPWMWRNIGIFEMPVLFGWLMLIIKTLKSECQFGPINPHPERP
jgi:hypothetical protein